MVNFNNPNYYSPYPSSYQNPFSNTPNSSQTTSICEPNSPMTNDKFSEAVLEIKNWCGSNKIPFLINGNQIELKTENDVFYIKGKKDNLVTNIAVSEKYGFNSINIEGSSLLMSESEISAKRLVQDVLIFIKNEQKIKDITERVRTISEISLLKKCSQWHDDKISVYIGNNTDKHFFYIRDSYFEEKYNEERISLSLSNRSELWINSRRANGTMEIPEKHIDFLLKVEKRLKEIFSS